MALKCSKSVSKRIAFSLSAETLKSLVRFLETISDEFLIKVGLSDGSELTCPSPDDVIGLPNTKERRITRLTLSTKWGSDPSVRVVFREVSYDSVAYEITGDDERVCYIADKLDEMLESTRQWYTRLAFMDFELVMLQILAAVILTGVLALAIIASRAKALSHEVREDSVRDVLLRSVVWLLIPVTFGFGAMTNRVRKWLFPISSFLVGQGVDRQKSAELWRSIIAVGFGIGLTVSIIGGLLVNWFSH